MYIFKNIESLTIENGNNYNNTNINIIFILIIFIIICYQLKTFQVLNVNDQANNFGIMFHNTTIIYYINIFLWYL